MPRYVASRALLAPIDDVWAFLAHVVPKERLAFEVAGDRVVAEIELRSTGEYRTGVTLAVEVPWLSGVRGGFPRQALGRLHALVQTGAAP